MFVYEYLKYHIEGDNNYDVFLICFSLMNFLLEILSGFTVYSFYLLKN